MIDKKKGLASVVTERISIPMIPQRERPGKEKVKGSLGRLQIYCFMDKKMH